MRKNIFGAVGIIWGGAILVFAVIQGGPEGTGAYRGGQIGGFVMGALLLVSGLYTFFREPRPGE